MQVVAHQPASATAVPPDPELLWSTLRALPAFSEVDDRVLRELVTANLVVRIEAPRDTPLVVPEHIREPLCLIASGQVSIGVFEHAALEQRGRTQRDAALGEQDGTLMPPGPLARSAAKNLALFGEGELFNLAALPGPTVDCITAAFSISRVVVVMIAAGAMRELMHLAPAAEQVLARALALTNARLRSVTGIKHEILDFYVRNGLSVAGPTVRLRQLDLCIDCKQCEDACEERHGSRRLTLGGFELGVLDFVFSCRTCADARCLSPCEHDAIKRDPKSGEVQIVEDRCIGCSLCALSCPYGAIDMINVAEPELASYNPQFKARLEKSGKLGFGPGKGRKAPARRIANKCDHCAGYGEQACVSACPTGALIEIAPATLFRERAEPIGKRRRRLHVLAPSPFVDGINVRDSGEARVRTRKLSILLWVLGLGSFLAVLAEVMLRWKWPALSFSYRMLRREGLDAELAEMNVSYLAGSKLALTCGYLGTALMVLSMAYLLQRRFKWFRKTATNVFWLDVHIMTGIVGPLFIVLHSALRLTTWVSIPFWSMTAVVISGLIGRYLYTLVPSLTNKHELEILAHRRAITELAVEHPAAAACANEIMAREAARSERSWEVGLISVLPWVLFDDLRRIWSRRRDRAALRRIAPRRVAHAIAARVDRVVFCERRNQVAPRSKALLKAWKRVHVPFSLVLLVTMVAHIGIALGFGE
jgi:Fe-S-cluster-containing hydrogenase component 2